MMQKIIVFPEKIDSQNKLMEQLTNSNPQCGANRKAGVQDVT